MLEFIELLVTTDFIAVMGIFVGVLTFSIEYFLDKKKRRRTSALEFITQTTLTEPMISENEKMYRLLKKFDERKPTIEDLNEDELRTVMMVCGFYEFIGLSLLQKLTNPEIILLTKYAVMKQTWNTFEVVINQQREMLDRRFLFGSFQKSVQDFNADYNKFQKKRYPEQF